MPEVPARVAEGVIVWIEFVVAVVVLSVVLGVVSRARPSRRAAAPASGAAPDGQRGEAWTAAGPLDAAFPVERTPRERHIGDAAFVDGLVIGHYLAPFRPAESRVPVQPGPSDRVLDDDDSSPWDGPQDDPHDDTDDTEDGFDEGFGIEDGFDDDW
ncbi:hypothetical protein [Nitriliruptor alkaliphilus]|uniref:hypothetical protein n=1 Tax=Nitriliruptor alkaliphilus TaxID=427918 RepID=UPI0012EDDBD9|nr:hypothetical protein [Nitriliruptor alkaliphilus]